MRRSTVLLCGIVIAAVVALETPAAGAQDDDLTWWALGDSYSSGEGIPGTEPPREGEPECARASGVETDAKAWAVVAKEALDEPRVSSWAFTPCTGAISSDVLAQIGEASDLSGADAADIVTLSMGGNDIFFADVIAGCLDLDSSWRGHRPGCDVDEATLRRRIDMLTAKTDPEQGQYSGLTLPATYDQIARNVEPGGAVIVLGYPQVLEEAERWSGWRRNALRACKGVLPDDVGMLRSVAGYLNEQIALAVQAADQRWSSAGISFHWRDIATGVYETGDDPSQRHALCSAEPWINAATIGFTSGDVRWKKRSFHPNQQGHSATGAWLGAWMRDGIDVAAMGTPPPSDGPATRGMPLAPDELSVEFVRRAIARGDRRVRGTRRSTG